MSIKGKYLKTAGLIWGVSLVLFAMMFFFVIKPQLIKKDELNNELRDLKKKVDQTSALASPGTKEDLLKEIEEMKTQLNAFLVESKKDIQGLAFGEILGISQEIELDEFVIETEGLNDIPAFNECKYVLGQPMHVSFNASFQEFATFLNILERHKSVIFVDTFSIGKSGQESGKHKVEMDLAVLVRRDAAEKNKQS